MTQPTSRDYDAGHAFIEASRVYLRDDYMKRLRRALTSLPEEDVWWRPNEASNSVGNLLLHLAGNARQWIVSGVGGRADMRERDSEFAARGGQSGKDALARLEEVVLQVDEVLSQLTPSALEERRTIQGNDVTVLQAIYHVVEHFSMHTGQILYIAKLRTGADLGLWRIGPDGSARRAW